MITPDSTGINYFDNDELEGNIAITREQIAYAIGAALIKAETGKWLSIGSNGHSEVAPTDAPTDATNEYTIVPETEMLYPFGTENDYFFVTEQLFENVGEIAYIRFYTDKQTKVIDLFDIMHIENKNEISELKNALIMGHFDIVEKNFE
jgi:hypothetical protein